LFVQHADGVAYGVDRDDTAGEDGGGAADDVGVGDVDGVTQRGF
jgi:hypothetical protein